MPDNCNLPRRFAHCTLDNFAAYNESLERAVTLARRFADGFSKARRGLLFEGQSGVGKTHIAIATLKQIVETTGARALFYDPRDLVRAVDKQRDAGVAATEIEAAM